MPTYVRPTMVTIGSFSALTRCVWWRACRDFLGCGRAPICI